MSASSTPSTCMFVSEKSISALNWAVKHRYSPRLEKTILDELEFTDNEKLKEFRAKSLESVVGKNAIEQERDRLYQNIDFIKESSPMESDIDEYGIGIKVSGDTVYNPERHFFII